jgi:predicted RNase H-like nuclease (RuvC/YqgF family)
MSDERLDKLLEVMLEMKDKQDEMQEEMRNFGEELHDFRVETNQRFDKLEANIDLLANKTWRNEKEIDFINKHLKAL